MRSLPKLQGCVPSSRLPVFHLLDHIFCTYVSGDRTIRFEETLGSVKELNVVDALGEVDRLLVFDVGRRSADDDNGNLSTDEEVKGG